MNAVTRREVPTPSGSGDDAGRPGAHGMARLWHGGKWVYYFGRKSIYQARMLIYRKTDGRTHDDWSTVPIDARTIDYPAAAGSNGYIALCWRDAATGGLHLTRTTDGVGYAAPRPLGASATAAPAATYEPKTGQLLVFYRGRGAGLYLLRSPDGTAFSSPIPLDIPGPLNAAPVATLARRAQGWVLLVQINVAGVLYECHTADGESFGPWTVVTRRGLNVPCDRDYPLALRVGPNLISPTRYERPEYGGADPWPFTLAATTAMAPTAVKFNLFYEGNYPRPIFNESQLDDVLALGVDTVIFRTAEWSIAPADVQHQLEVVDLNAGSSRAAKTYLDYIRERPQIAFLNRGGHVRAAPAAGIAVDREGCGVCPGALSPAASGRELHHLRRHPEGRRARQRFRDLPGATRRRCGLLRAPGADRLCRCQAHRGALRRQVRGHVERERSAASAILARWSAWWPAVGGTSMKERTGR